MQSAPLANADSGPTSGAVRRWLSWCIVAVYLAVAVGGITRLTESGLSITEWRPVSGILPPMSDEGWAAAYEAFQLIPQAQTTHEGITLASFKWIYWWEWFHRILARGVGLVFAVPYLVFLVRGAIPGRLRVRLAALPVLTLAQGVLGWYMVQSGLAVRTEVSAYRLAAHLALALGILVVALWTWADLALQLPASHGASTPPGSTESPVSPRWRDALWILTAMVAVTVISGAFVAGLRAGKIFNTFPLMGGEVVPAGYGQVAGWWRNALENPIAAQFHHRVLAMATLIAALIAAAMAGSRGAATGGGPPLHAGVAKAVRVLGAVVLLQASLGIATLVLGVPVVLGVLHQIVGVGALSAAVLALHGAKPNQAGL
jgi:cytochrome c oxidase assembly protein subunit 15